MKSGPTLAETTRRPRLVRAAIKPTATVVLPTPEWVPEITTRGPSVGTLHPATARDCGTCGVRQGCRLGRLRPDANRTAFFLSVTTIAMLFVFPLPAAT